jgi:hypothetical protein
MSVTKIIMIALLYGSGPLFMSLTNPQRTPLALLMLPFLWAFSAIFVTCWLALGRVGALSRGRRRLLLSGMTAALPVLLLVLNSIHQLTIRDSLIVITILVLLTVYLSRADFLK